MPLKNNIPEIIAKLNADVMAAEEAAAKLVAQSAKDRVPVATGRLRDAIHTERDEAGVWVIAGDRAVFYGHMVEHGTVNTPARPFLVPALEENTPAIVAIFAEAIRRAT